MGNIAAQQNLFNVPSSDITIKSTVFFQQQINFGKDVIQLNTTFCWGLGREAEIGVNVLGVDINTGSGSSTFKTNSDPGNPPAYPFYTINFQKAFTINKTLKVSFGTQAGYSKGFHFGGYGYGNLVTVIPKTRSKIITGIYTGSDIFLGPGDRNPAFPSNDDPVGFQLGLEEEVIKEKLLLIGEHISGGNSFGVTTVGAALYVSHFWVLSCGVQFANPGNNNGNSLVVEFTHVPSAHVSKHIFRRGHHEAD